MAMYVLLISIKSQDISITVFAKRLVRKPFVLESTNTHIDVVRVYIFDYNLEVK